MMRFPIGLHVSLWCMTLAVMILLSGVVSTGRAYALPNCENIENNFSIIGEARYQTNPSEPHQNDLGEIVGIDDTCYANSYWDGEEELSLPLGGVLGGAYSTASNLRFLAYVHHRDETSTDGTPVVFTVRIDYSNAHDADSCPDGTADYQVAHLTVDSFNPGFGCTGTDLCFAYGGKELGIHGLPFRRYWKSMVRVSDGQSGSTNECDKTDYGCWRVYDETECNIGQYWPGY